ncbi:Auxin-responsive protein SAUR32, partial [Mucuna pruriens]
MAYLISLVHLTRTQTESSGFGILMGLVKGKWKHNVILKAWERCRFSRQYLKLKATLKSMDDEKKKGEIAPHGCFSVHVGPERQRFVVKTKYVNHPLFLMLLEEAEEEYGFESDGPIWLPCNVDLFYKVLAEMDGQDNSIIIHGARRSFTMAKVFPFFLHINKDHTTYTVMDSELLTINRFDTIF